MPLSDSEETEGKTGSGEMEAAEEEMLTFSLAVTGMDGIRSEEVRGMLDVWEVNPERTN